MEFNFRDRAYSTKVWSPADGVVGDIIAFDTETAMSEDGKIPPFVIGQAYAGGDLVYFITLKHLRSFTERHRDCLWVMHNAPFDIAVVENETGFDFDPLIRNKRLFDTGLLYRLHRLGTVGQVAGPWRLDIIAQELLGIAIDKDKEVRCSFGQYRKNDRVYYKQIPDEALRYAAIDTIVTFEAYAILKQMVDDLDPKLHLSHKIQLMGAVALHQVSLNGIGFDLQRKADFLASLEDEIAKNKAVLAGYGYIPGQRGITKVYESVVWDLQIKLPRTASGKVSSAAEHLEEFRSQHPFIEALLRFKEDEKLKSFVDKLDKPRVHTRFTTLVNTGRTSSSSPNLQNLPRRPGIRECFIPAPGHCFLIIDYSQLELCTLAQVCYDRYGASKMRDLINAGNDLHSWLAGVITGKKDVTPDERQWAKAANFGFPGGLGSRAFVDYATKTYGVADLTEEGAAELKSKWLDAYPEMRRYLRDTLIDKADFSSLKWCDNPEIAVAMFKRIIGGETTAKNSGKPYGKDTLDWAFNMMLTQLAPGLAGRAVGSPELKAAVLRESVITKSGRIRANATYCQVRNTPFQGMAADGAKIALYRLIRAGYKVVNFIHDEFIIEIPRTGDFAAIAADIERIIVEAMRCMTPNVIIRTEWSITDRWYKKSKLLRDPETGAINIFTKAAVDSAAA